MSRDIQYLTRDQVDHLLAAIRHPRDRALFEVVYWRGLRASEAGLLRLGDWRPSARRLFVRRVKNGISAEYTVSEPERRALQVWLRDRGLDDGPLFPSERQRPISREQIYKLLRGYAAASGIPADLAHPHVLRHSIAVHLTEAGVNLPEIKDWLGHREISSTVIYAQLTNRRRDETADRFYAERLGTPALSGIKWRRKLRGGSA